MICLDTNVVIAFLNGRPPHLVERLEREMLRGAFALSVVTLFELQYGKARSARREENAERLAIFLQLPVTVLPSSRRTPRRLGRSAQRSSAPAPRLDPITS